MKILFANDSLEKLKFLALSENSGSGFLKTERIGRYIFITDVIRGNINKDSNNEDLINIYDLWGSKFGGVFLTEDNDIQAGCFFEKLILTLEMDKYMISYFDSDLMKRVVIREGVFNEN